MNNDTLKDYNSGIPIPTGFKPGAKTPLDLRLVVNTPGELDELINKHAVYEGMQVYVKDENTLYQYQYTQLDPSKIDPTGITAEDLKEYPVDQLESPAWHFVPANDARYLKYTETIPEGNSKRDTTYSSLAAVIKDLHNTVFAEPTISFGNATLDNSTVPVASVKEFNVGGEHRVQIQLNSPNTIGTCKISIAESLDGITFSQPKTQSIEYQQTLDIILAKAGTSGYHDYTYRISVSDPMKKTAYTKWSPGGLKQSYLEFKFKCTGIAITPQAASTSLGIYSLSTTSYRFRCSASIPRDSYGYLFYKLFDKNKTSSQEIESNWRYHALGIDRETGKIGMLNSKSSLPFDEYLSMNLTESDIGEHQLHIALVTNDKYNNEYISEDGAIKDVAAFLSHSNTTTSNSIAVPFDILPSSCIQTKFKQGQGECSTTIKFKSSVKYAFQIKSTADSLLVGGLNARVRLFYRTNLTDIADAPESSGTVYATYWTADKSVHLSCDTPTGGGEYFVLAQYAVKEFNSRSQGDSVTGQSFRCKDSHDDLFIASATNLATFVLFVEPAHDPERYECYTDTLEVTVNMTSVTTDSTAVTDDLMFCLDCLESEIDDTTATIENKASTSSTYQNLKLKIVNRTSADDIVDTGTEFNYLRLTPGAFCFMYNATDDSFYNPLVSLIMPSLDGDGSALCNTKGLTIETYARFNIDDAGKANAVVLGTTGAELISLGSAGAKIDTKGNNTHTVKSSLLEDEWQHVVFVIDKNDGTGAEDSIEPDVNYASLRIYLNGVLSNIYVFDKTITNDKEFLAIASTNNLVPLLLNYTDFASDSGANSIINKGLTPKSPDSAWSFNKTTGESHIKLLRIYEKALNFDEITKNYESILEEVASTEDYAAYTARNATNAISTILFYPKNVKDNEYYQNFYNEKDLDSLSFSQLIQINGKTPEFDTSQHVGSKRGVTNCVMFYKCENDDDWYFYPDVDVYLQGTSTLAYPVKNYKIKVYKNKEGERKKRLICPPISDDTNWPTLSSVYTLKCDFMEQSHQNNTPTAKFYQDSVLDAVIDSVNALTYEEGETTNDKITRRKQYYSPARQIIEEATDGSYKFTYRDAIDGIPCAVYYSTEELSLAISNAFHNYCTTSGETGTLLSACENENDALSGISTTLATALASATYNGTYMFNVDKAGDQLGFEISVEEAVNAGLIDPSVCIEEDDELMIEDPADSTKKLATIPCISYEGAANNNYAAAAFVPFDAAKSTLIKEFYEAILSTDATSLIFKDIVYDAFYDVNVIICNRVEKSDILPNGYSLAQFYTSSEATSSKNGILYTYDDGYELVTLEKVYNVEKIEEKYIVGEAKSTNANALSFNGLVSNQAADHTNLHLRRLISEVPEGLTVKDETTVVTEYWELVEESVFAYLNNTLEPRYSYIEEFDVKKPDDEAARTVFTPINNAISWVYENSDISNATQRNNFEKHFNEYFSLEYCLAYYLQMMVFAQIDNAGKNAMFDTWYVQKEDGGHSMSKLYPRPYDMDSQMGISNRGLQVIPAVAELSLDLSPTTFGGTEVESKVQAEEVMPGWKASSTIDSADKRFLAFNTSESRLWKTFGYVFKQKIKDTYADLRTNGIYTVEAITEAIFSNSSSKIGESFYNSDAVVKYLQAGDKQFSNFILGNRKIAYKKFLKDRLNFLDSYFDYHPGTDNKVIFALAQPTSDSLTAKDQNHTYKFSGSKTPFYGIVIATHSPQYISISIGSNEAIYTRLVTPDDYVEYDRKRIQGAYFKIPIASAKEKECYITGASDIKYILGLNRLGLLSLNLTACPKLSIVNLDYCTELTSLTLGRQEQLQELRISNTKKYGMTQQTGFSLTLADNSILRYIYAEKSRISSLQLENMSGVELLDLKNSEIQTLTLSNNEKLTNNNIDLSNCSLKNLSIDTCKNIQNNTSIKFYNSLLKKLTSLTLINNEAITELDLSGSNSLTNLTISSTYLKNLDLSSITSDLFNCTCTTSSGSTEALGLNLAACSRLENLNLAYSQARTAPANTFSRVILPKTADDIRLTLKVNNANIDSIVSNDSLTAFDLSSTNIDEDLLAKTFSKLKGRYDFYNIKFKEDDLSISNNNAVTAVYHLGSEAEKYTHTKANLFSACTKLATLACCYLDINPSGLFSNCSSLSTLEISNSSDTKYSDLSFKGAKYASVDGDRLTSTSVSAASMFYGCSVLSDDIISKVAQKLILRGCSSFSKYACSALRGSTGSITLNSTFFIPENAALEAMLNEMPSITLNSSSLLELLCKEVTDISYCFYGGTGLLHVRSGLFDKFTNITNAASLFRGCSNLTFVPQNLFKCNTSIKNFDAAFANCEQLGTANTLEGEDSACMLTTGDTGLFESANDAVTSVESMFYCCRNITASKDKLKQFFEQLSRLTSAKLAFYGCSKLAGIADNLFENNTKLCDIDGMFANSMTASADYVDLPENLAGSFPLLAVTSARGLFSGCSKLRGKITTGFFNNFPNLQNIGGAVQESIQTVSGEINAYTLGMFANTGIASWEVTTNHSGKFDLPGFTDWSYLFCKGTLTSNTFIAASPNENSSFAGFNLTEKDNNNEISGKLLQEMTTLKNLDFAFSNSRVEKIVLTGIDSKKSFLPPNIESAKGAFANCKFIKFDSTTDATLKAIGFKGLSNLTNIAYIFKNCENFDQVISANTFKDCNSLSNCTAAFMNSSTSGALPANLFESCRSELSNTKFMFYGTKITALNCGYARINDVAQMRTKFVNQLMQDLKKVFNIKIKKVEDGALLDKLTYENDQILFDGEALNIPVHLASLYTSFTNEVKNYLESAICCNVNLEKFYSCAMTYSDGNYQLVYSKLSSFGDLAFDTLKNELEKVLSNTNYSTLGLSYLPSDQTFDNLWKEYDSFRQSTENQIVDVIEKGLLSDCTSLLDVTGMFMNCRVLGGIIPPDMFACTQSNKINLTSIAYLFSGCDNLYLRDAGGQITYNSTIQNPSSTDPKQVSWTNGINSVPTASDGEGYKDMSQLNTGAFHLVYPFLVPSISKTSPNSGSTTVWNVINTDARSVQWIDTLNPSDPKNVNFFSLAQTGQLSKYTNYFLPSDWAKDLPNLQKIDHAFELIGTNTIVSNFAVDTSVNLSGGGATKTYIQNLYTGSAVKICLSLIIPNELFGTQNLTSAKYAFCANMAIGETVLNNGFLARSLSTLTNLQCMFAFANIFDIVDSNGSGFLDVSSDGYTLPLYNVQAIFAFVNNVQWPKVSSKLGAAGKYSANILDSTTRKKATGLVDFLASHFALTRRDSAFAYAEGQYGMPENDADQGYKYKCLAPYFTDQLYSIFRGVKDRAWYSYIFYNNFGSARHDSLTKDEDISTILREINTVTNINT